MAYSSKVQVPLKLYISTVVRKSCLHNCSFQSHTYNLFCCTLKTKCFMDRCRGKNFDILSKCPIFCFACFCLLFISIRVDKNMKISSKQYTSIGARTTRNVLIPFCKPSFSKYQRLFRHLQLPKVYFPIVLIKLKIRTFTEV